MFQNGLLFVLKNTASKQDRPVLEDKFKSLSFQFLSINLNRNILYHIASIKLYHRNLYKVAYVFIENQMQPNRKVKKQSIKHWLHLYNYLRGVQPLAITATRNVKSVSHAAAKAGFWDCSKAIRKHLKKEKSFCD